MGFPSQLAALANEFIGDKRLLSANGYQKLPGGVIVQWGQFNTGAIANNASGSHTFGLSFPTAILQLVVGTTQGVSSGVSGSEGFSVNSVSATGFNWTSAWGSRSDGDGAIRYIAIGY